MKIFKLMLLAILIVSFSGMVLAQGTSTTLKGDGSLQPAAVSPAGGSGLPTMHPQEREHTNVRTPGGGAGGGMSGTQIGGVGAGTGILFRIEKGLKPALSADEISLFMTAFKKYMAAKPEFTLKDERAAVALVRYVLSAKKPELQSLSKEEKSALLAKLAFNGAILAAKGDKANDAADLYFFLNSKGLDAAALLDEAVGIPSPGAVTQILMLDKKLEMQFGLKKDVFAATVHAMSKLAAGKGGKGAREISSNLLGIAKSMKGKSEAEIAAQMVR